MGLDCWLLFENMKGFHRRKLNGSRGASRNINNMFAWCGKSSWYWSELVRHDVEAFSWQDPETTPWTLRAKFSIFTLCQTAFMLGYRVYLCCSRLDWLERYIRERIKSESGFDIKYTASELESPGFRTHIMLSERQIVELYKASALWQQSKRNSKVNDNAHKCYLNKVVYCNVDDI